MIWYDYHDHGNIYSKKGSCSHSHNFVSQLTCQILTYLEPCKFRPLTKIISHHMNTEFP